MIKLFSLKQQSKEGGGGSQSTRKTSAAYLRIQKGESHYHTFPFIVRTTRVGVAGWLHAVRCTFSDVFEALDMM